jgi:protein-L-isoaspartate(D-aspartate) O-methyltransferase
VGRHDDGGFGGALECHVVERGDDFATLEWRTLRSVDHRDLIANRNAELDAVMVTAAPPKIPEPLKQQLKVGGRLVIPVGKHYQSLIRVTRTRAGYREESVIPVRFVPMTGKAQER